MDRFSGNYESLHILLIFQAITRRYSFVCSSVKSCLSFPSELETSTPTPRYCVHISIVPCRDSELLVTSLLSGFPLSASMTNYPFLWVHHYELRLDKHKTFSISRLYSFNTFPLQLRRSFGDLSHHRLNVGVETTIGPIRDRTSDFERPQPYLRPCNTTCFRGCPGCRTATSADLQSLNPGTLHSNLFRILQTVHKNSIKCQHHNHRPLLLLQLLLSCQLGASTHESQLAHRGGQPGILICR